MDFISAHPYVSAAGAALLATLLKGGLKKGSSDKPVVAVVPLRGTIDGGPNNINLDGVKKSIDAAFEIPDVKAVAFRLNSPGGSPFYSEELYSYIRQKAEDNTSVPIFMFIEDIGASGGYYVACAGDHIYASKMSMVGSIGVIASSFGLKGLADKLGIERRVWKEGANKCAIDPFLPVEEEQVQRLKSMQAAIHEEFIRVVKDRRQAKLDTDDAAPHPDLFTGAVWAGEEALRLGLVDGIGTCAAVMRERFGKNVQFKLVKPSVGFLRSLLENAGGVEMLCSRARAQLRMEL